MRHLGEDLPSATDIDAAMDVHAPDHVMGSRVCGVPVPRVEHGVVHRIAGQMRPLNAPLATSGICGGKEKPFPGPDEQDYT